jgi:superfamily II DNA or RNA helicase
MLRFFIDNNRLLFRFDYSIEIIRQLAKIPPEISHTTDKDLNCWIFPIDSIPKLESYLEIPSNIIEQYHKYEIEQQEEKGRPDFTITVESSYSQLIPKKSIIDKFNPKELDDVCSFIVKDAQYTDSYKSNKWDGRYRLFNQKNLKFPTGLLHRVTDILDLNLYSYIIKYLYPSITLHQYQWQLHNIDLRDYQLRAIETAFKEKRGILQMATGSGKTVLASGLIQRFGVATLFLVHTKDLLYQAYNVFSKVFQMKIGIIGDGNCEIAPITVATIQTLAPKIADTDELFGDWNYDIEQEYDEETIEVIRSEKPTSIESFMVDNLIKTSKLIIIDESHHVPSRTFYKIIMKTPTPYRFGLTATNFRDDGFEMKIESGLGKTLVNISASELIEQGYLVKPHIKFIEVPPQSFPRNATYNTVYKGYIIDNSFRNDIIISIAKKEMENKRQIMILIKQIRHLNLLHDLIPNSVIMWGEMKVNERKQVLNDFRNKKFQILIATSLADEGLDLPILDCLILAGSGKSSTKALQRIGRVIRLGDICPKCNNSDINIKNIHIPCKCNQCGHTFSYHGKQEAIVYDFIDNVKWLLDHHYRRKDLYQQEPLYQITKHKCR